MITQYLFRYMQERAESENMKFNLEPEFFEAHFNNGARNYFGVEVGDDGDILSDNQNPTSFDSPRGSCKYCRLLPFTSNDCKHLGRPVRG